MSRWGFLVALVVCDAVARADERAGLPAEAPAPSAAPIVGGETVPPGMWPDAVAVIGTKGSCTGTLIAPDVVLTAGHCSQIDPQEVIAATTDYATTTGVHVHVARTVAYPSWSTSYDISVLVLAEPISNVTPRAVGTSCTYERFTKATPVRLVGYGATSMDGTAANTQLKQAMTEVTDASCMGGNGCNPAIAPGGEFVAGGTGTADSCFGDSGGPVYLDTPQGPIVIGAVSRGVTTSTTPCGGGGIYVRTDKIIAWIESTTGRTITKDTCDGEDAPSAEAESDELGGCSSTHGSGFGAIALAVAALIAPWRVRRRRTLSSGSRTMLSGEPDA